MPDGFKQRRNFRHETARLDNSWLSTLVDTMNAVSEPQTSRRTCDSRVINAFKAKLERPASVSRARRETIRAHSDLTPIF